MMNNDMLANIEYLREKADVSYEEAERLLNAHDGNVMRALVDLEHQGRVYAQSPLEGEHEPKQAQPNWEDHESVKKAKSFLKRAFQMRLVIEKKTGDTAKMIACVPVPFAVITVLVAPWLAVGTAAVVFATGHNARVERDDA